MSKGEDLLNGIMGLNHTIMCESAAHLDKLPVTDLHNIISKTNVLRALVSLALQDKKFPIPRD